MKGVMTGVMRGALPSVYDTLYRWARKTTSFAELHFINSERDDEMDNGDGLIYRLKQWPDLPPSKRTADIYRALSVMSNRPVNRHWIISNTRMRPLQVDELLQRLVDEGAVDVVDSSKFASGV